MPTVVEFDLPTARSLQVAAGRGTAMVESLMTLRQVLDSSPTGMDVVVLGPSLNEDAALAMASDYRVKRPLVSFVLVRARVDSAVLASAIRAGIRDVVPTRDLGEVSAAVARCTQLSAELARAAGAGEPAPAADRGRIMTVFSAKGGAGKTTLATNLAVHLAQQGESVVLVDLDLEFGDVATALGNVEPEHSIVEAQRVGVDSASMAAIMCRHSSGLRYLPAPNDPDTGHDMADDTIRAVLEQLAQDFAFVVVDTPPTLRPSVLAAFDVSDLLIVLTTLDMLSLKNLGIAWHTLNELQFPLAKRQLVCNRADSHVRLTVGQIEGVVGSTVSCRIPSSPDVPASQVDGDVLVSSDPGHPVSRAIADFAEMAAGRPVIPESRASIRPRRRRWWQRRKDVA
ncbi:MAG: AAA family ATPase [Candidatus Nanopelagicales bacterium]|nr:AAA family ATPase [Candidatus Nanopelagicales bacterium]